MAIQQITIRKLLREHFTGENPIQVASEERKELGETIRKRIKGLNHVSVDARPYISKEDEARFVCEFSIKEPRNRYSYSYSNNFTLIRNKRSELVIRHYVSDALVSDIEELLSFIAACQERVERQQVLKSKREKIRGFKTQAIIAQVKNLAKEEKFDFYTETDTVKLKLYIRLSKNECVELHIPFKKFQEILPELRTAILSLRELHGKGIKFKIRSTHSYRYKWAES